MGGGLLGCEVCLGPLVVGIGPVRGPVSHIEQNGRNGLDS